MVGIGGKKSFGDFPHSTWGKTPQSTIKILKNTHTKNRRLKIEAVTKMDDWITICQHKTEELYKIEISTLTSLEV